MKIHANETPQTFRLVDEHRERMVPGRLSLLLPGPQGGHLLLAFAEDPWDGHGGPRALGVARARGTAEAWQLLESARRTDGQRRNPTLPRRVFQFAFVANGRSLVFYERPRDEEGGRATDA
jgi:hypothetical protein